MLCMWHQCGLTKVFIDSKHTAHRDLKVENLLLDSNMDIKIIGMLSTACKPEMSKWNILVFQTLV